MPPLPWTPREIKLLGTRTDREIAEKIGRTQAAVTDKRLKLGIAPSLPREREWTAKELALLGTMSDATLADMLNCSRKHVVQTRERNGVAAFSAKNKPKKWRKK